MMKIGMLTSGGDCQALNAAMRGVVKGLTTNVDELEIYGFENGYKGLIYEQYRILTASDFFWNPYQRWNDSRIFPPAIQTDACAG